MPRDFRRESRRRIGAVVVLLLVVLAGCEGALGGLGEDPSRSTTGSPTIDVGAPGVTANGVTDPDALLRAHVDSLTDRSYTARSTVTVRFPNGSVRGRRIVVMRVYAERDRIRFRHHLDGRLPWAAIEGAESAVVNPQSRHVPSDISRTAPISRSIRGYRNETGTYLAIDRTNGVTYHQYPADLNPATVGAFELDTVLKSAAKNLSITSITQARVDGWSAYRFRGTTSDGDRVSATIDSFGLIYNLTVTRSLPDEYGGGVLEYHIAYTAFGRTTVDRPDWMAEIRQQSETETVDVAVPSGFQVLSGRSPNGLEETATREVTLTPEYAIFNIEHEGTGRIAVWLFNGSHRERMLLNTTGNYQGVIVTNVNPDDHRLHVQADGPWRITVRNGSTPPTAVTGPIKSEPNVTYAGPFPGDRLRIRFRGTDHNVEYQSWFVAGSGSYRDFFVIEDGPVDTTRHRFRLPGVFYIGLRTTGDWVIEIRPVVR
ncbi:MAG: hypothetical protein ABEH65_11580 [Halobacteriales archaeon]